MGGVGYAHDVRTYSDVFPARVIIDGHTTRRARVTLADDGRAALWVDGAARGSDPTRVALTTYTNVEKTPRGMVVTLEDGTTWTVVKGGGCGCGSMLKRMSARELLA